MQRLCKSNAMKLASIAEMPPILCKNTFFLSHRQTSWIILTQRLRKTRADNITQMIPPISLKQYRLYHSNDTDVLYTV